MRDAASHRRALRRGMTLIEVMVVMAILAIIAAVGFPAMSGILDLQQRGAAKELAQTYTWLIDEAVLRNVSFRVVYNLDRNTYKVEVGDPNTLVFSNPEDRQEYEEDLADKMSRYTKREIAGGSAEDEDDEMTPRFEGLTDSSFEGGAELPSGARFEWVYTPQYGEEGIRPSDTPPENPEDEHIAYTYIFADGTAEHAVIRIHGVDDPEDGYTIEVEPLSGEVRLSSEIVEPTQSMQWLPDEGPTFQ